MINTVCVVVNAEKDPMNLVTSDIENFLTANGITVYKVPFADDRFEPSPDFIVTLGGDGTILTIAGAAAVRGIPILGINLGVLGYLTDVDKNEAKNAISKVLNGDYKLERRMMLEAQFGGETFQALNDVCIHRGGYTRLVSFEYYINNEYIDSYRADGIIFSTPTGSTAYNLSAGGPVLKPDSEMMAVTPICPHSLYNRPSVLPASDEIRLLINSSTRSADKNGPNEGVCTLVVDGAPKQQLNGRNELLIKKSQYCVNIIKTNRLGFYEILRTKLV